MTQQNDNESIKTELKKEIKELDVKLRGLNDQINTINDLQSEYLKQKRLKITNLMAQIKETSDITQFIGKWFIRKHQLPNLNHKIFFVCKSIDDQKGLVGIQYSFYAQYEYKALDIRITTLGIQYFSPLLDANRDEYENYRVINDHNEEYQLNGTVIPPELAELVKSFYIKIEDDIQ